MFEPEYRASFGVLRREIGLFSTARITIPSIIKSRKIEYVDNDTDTEPEKKKNSIKNHFKLLSILYEKLKLTALKKTKTGFSTDAGALKAIQHESPVIAKILDYREKVPYRLKKPKKR